MKNIMEYLRIETNEEKAIKENNWKKYKFVKN